MAWFNNMKVGRRLITGFLMVAAITAVVGALGIAKMRQMDAADTKLYEKITVPLSELAAMSTSFQRVRINLRDALETKDPGAKKASVDTVNNLRQEVGTLADSFEKTILTEEGHRLFKEFKESREAYGQYIQKTLELDQAGKGDEAMALLHGDARKAALHEQELLNKLMESKKNQAKLTAETNVKEAGTASIFMIVLIVVGVLLALGLGQTISKSVTKPLEQAVSIANALAGGDLRVEVEVKSQDETGQLMAALQNMVHNLRQLMSDTINISNSIASASHELHATSDQIATGSEEVACQTGTVASASEQMSATSIDIARNCTAAVESSMMTSTAASNGSRVVQETIGGMTKIADRVRETARTVDALGSRSEQIGEIIGTIEDIADQTNLLALNAAIEAARAGEQGRGFAVVADEVRALAERTTRATKEIGEMIKAIQNETKQAVRAMEEGVSEVERGAVSSQKSGEALTEILEQINQVTAQIHQISTAAEEQTATTSEITTNMQQISEVVQQTSRGAEETSTAAAQLADQAQQLQTIVGRFKVA
jgi:methyl-accepting chemotaxis protein